MAKLPMFREILGQSVKKPVTNLFPTIRMPKSITRFFRSVTEGKAEIVPPVATPPVFRGKIVYDRTACNGCGLCLKVCPTHAIEQVAYPPMTVTVTDEKGNVTEKLKTEKRIRIYIASCVFCGQCSDICTKGAVAMGNEFLLATEDRFAEEQIAE
ncbi:MAG: 4Fe-4S binding protein [Methanocalculaceae archaeon]|jgi:formate hydrogenlyase subunit 6/NADH:ubiquinone oxidoreductase subunit I|nr:4Fe-4S binding protein [Methanocalculaceae archaeon]